MSEKIFWIITFLNVNNINLPYWGVVRNCETKSFLQTKENYKLKGKWLYIIFKNDDPAKLEKFKELGYTPDFSAMHFREKYLVVGFKLEVQTITSDIQEEYF